MMHFDPPPSRIYLLRHAQSAWALPGERDFDRMLDDAGYAQAEIVSERAAARKYMPELVISSTATRCRQTADAIRRAFGEELPILFVDTLYNGALDAYMEMLSTQKQSASVMLIGHNPAIETVLEALIGPDMTTAAIPGGYPTAGLAVIDHRASSASTAPRWALTDFLRS